MILCAVLTTLCSLLLSASVQWQNHTVMQQVKMLLMVEPAVTSSFSQMLLSLSTPVISPTTVVSSANLTMVLLDWAGLQSVVQREQSNRLSTHACGEPVLSVRVEERWCPSLTVWGRLEKKKKHRAASCCVYSAPTNVLVLNLSISLFTLLYTYTPVHLKDKYCTSQQLLFR